MLDPIIPSPQLYNGASLSKLGKLYYCYSVLHWLPITRYSIYPTLFSLLPLHPLSCLSQTPWETLMGGSMPHTVAHSCHRHDHNCFFHFFSLFLPHHSYAQSWLSLLRDINFNNYANYLRPQISNMHNRDAVNPASQSTKAQAKYTAKYRCWQQRRKLTRISRNSK